MEKPMTTRRGEPLETERQSVEDILRPLVERTVERVVFVPDLDGPHDGIPLPRLYEDSPPGALRSVGTVMAPDTRFDALRRLDAPMYDYNETTHKATLAAPGIDSSLGAIVRAAAACGWKTEISSHAGQWQAIVQDRGTIFPFLGYGAMVKFGAIPEEAAARALVAAVGDEIPLYQSPNMVVDDWKSPGPIFPEAQKP